MSEAVSESETVKMMVYAAALPSILCIVLHLWKFYQSAGKQSLVTKNLTLYSFFLLLFTTFIISPSYYDETIYPHIEYLDVYLESATAFFKFIIVVQIFLYFYRNPYPQRPPSDSDSQNTEFRNYCILGFLIPLIYTIVLYSVPFFHQRLPYGPYVVVFPTMKIIRIANLFPIFGTIWHLKSSGIDRTELLTKYPVETRLMLTIAAHSILLNLAQLIYWIFTIGSYTHDELLIDVTNELENIGFAVEGIVIAILFTYRADTFKPVGSGESILAQ